MRRQKPASLPPRDPHWLHSWNKVIGPVETALLERVDAVSPRVAPFLKAVFALPRPDDWYITHSVDKILQLTWPALLERVAAIRKHRDWQFESWGASHSG